MSDWEFLHDMHEQGYSAEEISDAAAVGYAPWDAKYVELGDEPLKLKQTVQTKQPQSSTQTKAAVQGLEGLRQSGVLTRSQFLACKGAVLKQKSLQPAS